MIGDNMNQVFIRKICVELTPRHVLRNKKRASAGPKGWFLSALKDDCLAAR